MSFGEDRLIESNTIGDSSSRFLLSRGLKFRKFLPSLGIANEIKTKKQVMLKAFILQKFQPDYSIDV